MPPVGGAATATLFPSMAWVKKVTISRRRSFSPVWPACGALQQIRERGRLEVEVQ
jgi:hypothetical protein